MTDAGLFAPRLTVLGLEVPLSGGANRLLSLEAFGATLGAQLLDLPLGYRGYDR